MFQFLILKKVLKLNRIPKRIDFQIILSFNLRLSWNFSLFLGKKIKSPALRALKGSP